MYDSGNIYIAIRNLPVLPLLLPKIVKNANKVLYIYITQN